MSVSQGAATTELVISMNCLTFSFENVLGFITWWLTQSIKTIDALKIFPEISWFLRFFDFPRFNINRFQGITEYVDTFAFSSCILVETVVTNI